MKKKLIVIEGPTASGKTALGVELAIHFKTEIISADSRQFFKELAIGTAKPSKIEQKEIVHHFVDSHSIDDEISSSVYAKQVEILLTELFQKNEVVIMVGGSGMYIDAVCIGLDSIPHSKEIQAELNTSLEQFGLNNLLEELALKDPVFYESVDKANAMRIIRALEAILITGEKMSDLQKKELPKKEFEVIRFVINHERSVLYDRINRRVDQMIENGLIDEVKSVFDKRELKVLKTVGYSELFQFLEDEISLERAVELIKQNTRRYAKRQLTWFRRHTEAYWLAHTSLDEMKIEVIDYLSE